MAFRKWPDLSFLNISPNAHFATFFIHDNEYNIDTFCIKAVNRKWEVKLLNVKSFPVSFTNNSKYLIFINNGDSLNILDLISHRVKFIPDVASFNIPESGISDWLIYQLKSATGTSIALNLFKGKQITLRNSGKVITNKDEEVIVLSEDYTTIHLVNLAKQEDKIIFSGYDVENLVLNNTGNLTAFLGKKNKSDIESSLWLYDALSDKTEFLMNPGQQLLKISDINRFSIQNDALYFNAIPITENVKNTEEDVAKLSVWSYTDTRLQSLQKRSSASFINLTFCYRFKDKQFIQLQDYNETILYLGDTIALIDHKASDAHVSEWIWNPGFKSTYMLVSTLTGQKRPLKAFDNCSVEISPSGNFFVFYSKDSAAYFSYNVRSTAIRNITKSLPYKVNEYRTTEEPRGIAGWLEEQKIVYIYDKFDVWKVDLLAETVPDCITGKQGRKTNRILNFLNNDHHRNFSEIDTRIVLSFNPETKDNGFCKVYKGKLTVLYEGPYIFDISKVHVSPDFPPDCNFDIQKIDDTYFLKKSSVNEYGNYYATSDFSHFIPLSQLHPERQFNWFSSKLFAWQLPDGKTIQAVLYIPDNIDINRKYPLIFRYYEKKSDTKNAYLKPGFLENNCTINIPYWLSKDYLVACVDIDHETGSVGNNTLTCLESAAVFFARMPFIDNRKMGINGFSFGGYETYFTAMYSKKFAAAAGGAGSTDLISHFGGLRSKAVSNQELRQYRLGSLPWDSCQVYIRNSPLFGAKLTQTPLLMMSNTNDDAVDISQAVELFTALRRLGKKVWLLEYEEGNHYVMGKSAKDYSRRLMQFFDHYLKDKPAPIWMTQGIPASKSKWYNGLEYDTSVKTPGLGLTNDGEPWDNGTK